MIYIDLFDNPPPQDLIDEGVALTKELAALPPKERNQFIDDHDDYWGKLKEHFSRLSHGKCWYTEAKEIASRYDMDHFRPKKKTICLKEDSNCNVKTSNNVEGYWWLTFDWQNYRMSCKVSNTTKGNYFPLLKGTSAVKPFGNVDDEEVGLLDPTNQYDVMLIGFGLDGKVYPTCTNINSWDAQRVMLSKRVYNLDFFTLVEERIKLQQLCKRKIEGILRAQRIYESNKTKDSRAELKEKVQELKDMTKPEAELSAVARNYIRNYHEEFIRNIVG